MAALGEIKYLTIHCTATPEFRDVKASDIEAWDIAKFNQKSYHYIILLDGTVHRSLPDTIRGAHVGNHNTGNLGVAYVGGMDKANKVPKDTRNSLQKNALRTLVAELQQKYPALKVADAVRGHRDWPGVAKACPSFDVKTQL